MKNQQMKIKSYYRNINVKDREVLRIHLYGIITEIVLSKSFFEKNEDIKNLLHILDLQYKGYVMKSRANILTRIIRDIEVMDNTELLRFHENVKRFLIIDMYNRSYKDNKPRNIMDDISKQIKNVNKNKPYFKRPRIILKN